MFRHVVMMKLQETSTDADLTAIIDGLSTLPALVPEILSYSIGRDLDVQEGSYDLVIVADFEDRAAFDAYNANQDHLDVIGTQICLLYTSPSPRDKRQSRMPSSA